MYLVNSARQAASQAASQATRLRRVKIVFAKTLFKLRRAQRSSGLRRRLFFAATYPGFDILIELDRLGCLSLDHTLEHT